MVLLQQYLREGIKNIEYVIMIISLLDPSHPRPSYYDCLTYTNFDK